MPLFQNEEERTKMCFVKYDGPEADQAKAWTDTDDAILSMAETGDGVTSFMRHLDEEGAPDEIELDEDAADFADDHDPYNLVRVQQSPTSQYEGNRPF